PVSDWSSYMVRRVRPPRRRMRFTPATAYREAPMNGTSQMSPTQPIAARTLLFVITAWTEATTESRMAIPPPIQVPVYVRKSRTRASVDGERVREVSLPHDDREV